MTSLGQKKASPSPFKTPNKASQNPESALGGAKDIVSGATDTGGDTVSGAADQAPGPAKDAGKTAGGTTKDLGSKTSESAPKPPATPKTAAKPPVSPKTAAKPPATPKTAAKPPVSPKTAAKPPVSPKTAQKAPVTPKKAPKPKEAVGTSSTGKKVEKNTDKIQKQGKDAAATAQKRDVEPTSAGKDTEEEEPPQQEPEEQEQEQGGSAAGSDNEEVAEADTQDEAAEDAGGEVQGAKDDIAGHVGKVGKGAKSNVTENEEPVGQVGQGKPQPGAAVSQAGDNAEDKGDFVGEASSDEKQSVPPVDEEGGADQALDKVNETKPDFTGPLSVDEDGKVKDADDRTIANLSEEEAKKLEGSEIADIDASGNLMNKEGEVIGSAELAQATEQIDYSVLKGLSPNKAGNLVAKDGITVGRIVEGNLKKLHGRRCTAKGEFFDDAGKKIGQAEPIPEDERSNPEGAPFEDFEGATVQQNGDVVHNGEKVGEIVEGDVKKIAGKAVDADGDVVDKSGTIVGKAKRWYKPDDPEPEKLDLSLLAGNRVNKSGYVVDNSGKLLGRVVEGDPAKLVGKMCDKEGQIWNEGGSIVGRAELLPESEREGQKEGPFSDFQPATVRKDGKVIDNSGTVVGRLVEGDVKKLQGKSVDEQGDVVDKNGNKIGSAERWEEEEKVEEKHPAAGLKVNSEGAVIDKDGNTVAKLTEGEIARCRGKEIDNDGDVVDGKGKSIGHVTLMQDLPKRDEAAEQKKAEEEEARKAAEQKEAKEEEARKAAEQKKAEEDKERKEKEEVELKKLEGDKKLAKRMAYEPVLDEMIDLIEDAQSKPKEEVNQDELVKKVKPLIHKSSDILNQCNSNIREMDPDGRMQQQAKENAATGEASPEERHLAEGLKRLSTDVTDAIRRGKKGIEGMPEAKKGISPLWHLLEQPLVQIIAAVGLLLSGVLGLVNQLLGGLGLNGLLSGLLGGLGLDKILGGLGVPKLGGK
ncbi:LEA domain protein [Cryptococcus gattii WM276]|uniref:LEA domain protein n=1 Tax=Cryptococcus gattii serotype B (strain WM276 / ATCC MYA-4071) TaxID=367775 RepID=E6QYU4_CRYGW|nr:LEA domain protein [Cryptococcus gattii WM276]ADV19988.1 LEA domain protein [Cryptococcus gattii WM276]